MYRIKIFSVGKTKEPWLLEALGEYEKRLKSQMEIEWVLSKDSKGLQALLDKEDSFIALTLGAKEPNSEQFAEKAYFWLEKFGSRLSFVIGGSEGLSEKVLTKSFARLSFSKLTFTHQMTRLILLEQLYRAAEIMKGSGYHK
jgi:23S rRNA (pseudouridine1915-N3)-methyltransferase